MCLKQPAIYIVTNKPNGTLYIGVTSDLIKRIYEHKQGFVPCFTKKYSCKRLVYFEQADSMISAIEREKQLKNISRSKKINLIQSINPAWDDLFDSII